MAEPDLMQILQGLLGGMTGGSQGGLFDHPLFPSQDAPAGGDPFGGLFGGTGDLGDRQYMMDILTLLSQMSEGALDREIAQAQIGASGAGAGAARYSADLQYKLGQAQLAETLRANKARELEDTRQRAMSAASVAVSSFLESQSLADARRMKGIEETRLLLPSLVDPNREFFASPTGPGATMAGRLGLGFEPTRIQHREIVSPGLQLGMGAAVGNRNILDAIEQLRGAGSA